MQILPELSASFVAKCVGIPKASTRDLKSKEIIYLEKPVGKTFVVKRGYVRLAFADADGRLLTRMLLGKGAVFGDVPFSPPLFVAQERAIASGMTCILEVNRSTFESWGDQDSQFQTLLLQVLSSQLNALDRRMQWQLLSPIKTRIATALFDLLCFSGGRCGHGHLIDVRLTHEEFAELVVAARPVVSTILAELKTAGIIDYTRGHICLLSLDRLEEIAKR